MISVSFEYLLTERNIPVDRLTNHIMASQAGLDIHNLHANGRGDNSVTDPQFKKDNGMFLRVTRQTFACARSKQFVNISIN